MAPWVFIFPGRAKQGKKKIFIPLFSTVFSFKKTLTKDPYLPKAFHVLEKREERCPSGGCKRATPTTLPLCH
jgi:hypothetical protein